MKTKKLLAKTYWIIIIFLILIPLSLFAEPVSNRAINFYNQGLEQLRLGDYYNAIEYFDKSLEVNPHYKEPIMMTALSYLKLGELDEAQAYVELTKQYTEDDINLMVIEARINIIQGNFDSAEKVLNRIREIEPKNVEAKLLSAELAIAEGKTIESLSLYREVLTRKPENKTALLALIIMSSTRMEPDSTELLIETALQYHWEDPQVHLVAARYYLNAGKPDKAETFVRNALAIRDNYTEALETLSQILYEQGRFLEAVDTIRNYLETNKNSANWYLLAQSHYQLGNFDRAIETFQSALTTDPDDYIARAAMEEIVSEETTLEDPLRSRISEYHIAQAKLYSEQYRLTEARSEYRRALSIYPYSEEARIGYAETFLMEDFEAKYLQELKVLTDLGINNQYIKDHIEVYESVLRNNPAAQWEIDQFLIEKDRIPFSVYHIPGNHLLDHPDSSQYLLDAFKGSLLSSERVAVRGSGDASGYAEAYRKARESESDFFLIIQFEEDERTFGSIAEIFVSRTGTKIDEIREVTKGNDRVQRAFLRISESLQGRLPLIGTIIQRNNMRGLINLGAMDGVAVDMVFTIVKEGSVSSPNREGKYLYTNDSVIGTFTAQSVDDLISSGLISRQSNGGVSLFDVITTGDRVILTSGEDLTEVTDEWVLSPLYRRLMELPLIEP